MNFFKAVFADDDPESESPSPSSDHESSPSSSNPTQTHQPTTSVDDQESEPSSNQTAPSAGWSFGGLVKTLHVKSHWIETYRRGLEEFGSGLRKETEVLREVASRAVKELPSSLETGASKAQVSLESVGQAIDSIGLAVADIISQGKESLLAPDNDSSDANDVNSISGNSNMQSVSSGRYSRFDAQLRAIQCDVNTYVEEPDDVADYNEWLSEFNLVEKSEEIEGLMRENGNIDGIYKRLVPNTVEHDVFWSRYFYRVHRLQQAESMRVKLVKRAISTEDEEELSWDVDDDEEEDVKKVDDADANMSNATPQEDNEKKNVKEEHKVVEESHEESSVSTEQRADRSDKVGGKEKSTAVVPADKEPSNKEAQSGGTSKANDDDEASKKLKEKVAPEGKTEAIESGKDSDISVVSTQPTSEEDDMGWDEIEDIGSDDEKKLTRSRSPNREELRKRLSVADDDEDLIWDIEDDD